MLVFLIVLNRSPTFQSCHQHISSPTSVTNIDVAFENISSQRNSYFYEQNLKWIQFEKTKTGHRYSQLTTIVFPEKVLFQPF